MVRLVRPWRALFGVWIALIWAAGLGLPASGAWAGPAASPAAESGSDGARAWLARIHAAANRINYEGTLVFRAGDMLSSSRVWHYCVGDQTYEKRETLDGRPQRVLRHNDTTHTLWPQGRTLLVESGRLMPGRANTPGAIEPRALEHYEFRREGGARIAGRDADVFLLAPRDVLRYPQRFWADRATGLMLRADVLDAGLAVLESAAFSEIEFDVRPQHESVVREMRRQTRDPDLRVLNASKHRTELEAEGWTLAQPVAGFELAGCVKRPVADDTRVAGAAPNGPATAPRGADVAAQGAGAGGHIVQAVFFDGLTHVSLFIEPYDAQRHRGEMQARMGATSTVTRRRDGFWITALGDVPPPTLQRFIDGLKRR